MKPIVALSVALAGAALAAPPPGYYQSALSLTGPALRVALHTNVRTNHTTPLSYSATRIPLTVIDADPAQTDRVILIYTRRSEPKENFVGTSGFGLTDKQWNREHLWPNSLGIDDANVAYADLFNLRPADVEVNSVRANLPFDETLNNGTKIVPGAVEAPLTSRDPDSWEPPAEVKGDLARAAFYMDLRYDGEDGVSDLRLTDNTALISSTAAFMGKLTTLLLWHLADPVSDEERLRNDRVQSYQGNRNPFVDHPSWATAIFGDPYEIRSEATAGQLRITYWGGHALPTLESSTELTPITWTASPGSVSASGAFATQSFPLSSPLRRRFFRLRFRGIEAP
jgi:serine protease